MKHPSPPTAENIGELKATHYCSRSVRDELRENLIAALKDKVEIFSGIHGYENSVIPDLQRAILSRHHINLLGLRGQAKTRLARSMVSLLDEWTPYLLCTDLREDPLAPISGLAKKYIAEMGDLTEIGWMHRDDRYFEKLATPDVSVADLVGDVDPIKAANMKLSYSDERVIHFGMIPRAHRSIFVINELPDLQPRIQVSLFNILQEGDIQIRGFQLRLPIDIQFVFTANPEDYTNRGSIVTPLKDRIGSQILTHYPEDVETAAKITRQEARIALGLREKIYLPELAAELLEQIGFEARESEFVDPKSGVSARLSVSALENLYSAAERRMLINSESETRIRLSDFAGIVPSIIGKVELVYEGEQEGPDAVAEHLIGAAVKSVLPKYFPAMEKLKQSDPNNPYLGMINAFGSGASVELHFDDSDSEYRAKLESLRPLLDFSKNQRAKFDERGLHFAMEFVLWALSEHARINRDKLISGTRYSDLYSGLFSKEDSAES